MAALFLEKRLTLLPLLLEIVFTTFESFPRHPSHKFTQYIFVQLLVLLGSKGPTPRPLKCPNIAQPLEMLKRILTPPPTKGNQKLARPLSKWEFVPIVCTFSGLDQDNLKNNVFSFFMASL